MPIEGKNILMISPERWSHVFVSKHHYAINLARKNNRLYFLNPPGKISAVTNSEYPNLFLVHYRGFPRGLRYYPSRLKQFFIKREFARLQQSCNTTFDLVWSFDNSVFFDFNALPPTVLKICHIVDLNQNFQTGIAASSADICFCTTEAIKNRLSRFNPRVFKINHGFNDTGVVQPVSLPGNAKFKVVYSGNLAMPYIDWALIDRIIRNNPARDFIFIGPGANNFNSSEASQNKAKQRVIAYPNAFFPGMVQSGDLMRYLTGADALLVAYQERYHGEQANPHKLMEYIGTGKVAIATKTAEFEPQARERLIAMADSNDSMLTLFEKVATNIDIWNSDELKQKRIEFAKSNSYEKQIERIEKILAENNLR